jgi:hypothetical protein
MIDQARSRPAGQCRRSWLLALVTLVFGVATVSGMGCCHDLGPATPVLAAHLAGEPQPDRTQQAHHTHHPDQPTAGNCAPIDLGVVGDLGADPATGARVSPARHADVAVPSRRAPPQPSRPPSLAQLCLLRQ